MVMGDLRKWDEWYAASRQERKSGGSLGSSHLGSHLGSEVVHLLLDAFAHDEEREALDRGASGLEHLLDGLLVVLHESLVEQRDFLQVLLHAAFDALGNEGGV